MPDSNVAPNAALPTHENPVQVQNSSIPQVNYVSSLGSVQPYYYVSQFQPYTGYVQPLLVHPQMTFNGQASQQPFNPLWSASSLNTLGYPQPAPWGKASSGLQ